MNTILKFCVELEELVGRKLEMAPNRMFQQLTDKTKKKTRNFQKFLGDDGNESLQYNPPLPPSLDSTYKDPWRKSWLQKVGKAPNENRPGHASHDVMWRI